MKSLTVTFNKIIVCFLLIFFLGCTTPNVQPFAESTGTVVSMFKMGSSRCVESLELSGKFSEASSLKEDLRVRYELLDALLKFSVNISKIQSDSDSSKESVSKVSKAVNELAFTLSSGFSAPITAIANKLSAEALEIHEFHKISKSITKLEPHIETLSDLLIKDIESVRKIYVDSMTDASNEKEDIAEDLVDEALEKRIGLLEREIIKEDPDNKKLSQYTVLYSLWKNLQEQQKKALQESQKIRNERRRGNTFYNAVKEGVAAWLKSYKDLSQAFEDNRQPDFLEFYLKAQEIKNLSEAI